MNLGTMVVDIPIEDEAADKALEVELFYDSAGFVDRSTYTWLLYARSNMSYSQLRSFRARIIKAAQDWKRDHGLDQNLFALIVELARVGVIWRPSAPTPDLDAETFWLWKEMGFAAIRDDALRAGGIALRAEAASIRRKVAVLDTIVDLPKKIAMGSVDAAMAATRVVLKQYIETRNKTVLFIQGNYSGMMAEGRGRADEIMEKVRGDDEIIRNDLAQVGMSLGDFGTAAPATLGAVVVASLGTAAIIVLAVLVAFVTAALVWHKRIQIEMSRERVQALKLSREKNYAAIKAEAIRRVAALSPTLTPDERNRKIAEIEAWAAAEKAKIAKEYTGEIKVAQALAERGIPWGWIIGGGITAAAVWGVGRTVHGRAVKAEAKAAKALSGKKTRRTAEQLEKAKRWAKFTTIASYAGVTAVVVIAGALAIRILKVSGPPTVVFPTLPQTPASPQLPAPAPRSTT